MALQQAGLSLNGLGSAFDLNRNGSVSAKHLWFENPSSEFECHVYTVEWSIVDTDIKPLTFLGEAGALANGLDFQITTGDQTTFTVVRDILTDMGGRITTTWDLVHKVASDWTIHEGVGGSTDDMMVLHMHSSEVFNQARPLVTLQPGEQIRVIVNDNLTGVTEMAVKVYHEVGQRRAV